MTRLDPFDYESVSEAKTQVRIVDTTKDQRIHDVTINGIEYQIPKIVVATEDSSDFGTVRTFSDGPLAVKALQDDSALAYRLLPATTNSDISLSPLNKSLPQGNQFYFFVNDHDAYSGGLRDYLAYINEEELLTHVSKLVPFDATNPEVVQAYVEFFDAVGSHFVTNTGFGARFLLEVWALNKYKDVNDNFVRDITASLKGLNNGGNYDNTVFGEAQYWNFNRLSQRIIRIRGGDSDLADSLVLSPDYPKFEQWLQSIRNNAELITLRATALWTLLRDADNAKLRACATDVQNAFEYLSSLRQPNDKRTWITFESKSNWAEFGILTPSAVIGGGDTDQFAVQQPFSLGPAKLSWGQPNCIAENFIAVCEINNDGTPIDIYVGCGSGSASVRILGKEYVTNGGFKRFSNVPVSL